MSLFLPEGENKLKPKEFLAWALTFIINTISQNDPGMACIMKPFIPVIQMKLRRMTEEEAKDMCNGLILMCDAIANAVEKGVNLE